MHLSGQINRQIPSLDRPEGIIQRIFLVCLRYYADHRLGRKPDTRSFLDL